VSEQEEILGKAYDARLLRRIWGYVKRYPGLFLGSLLLLPIVMVFDLLQPKILQLAIDRAIATGDLHKLPLLALAFLGALLGQHTAGFFQLYCLQLLGQQTTNDLRRDLYRHLLSLRMAFFDHTPVGRLMTRVSSDVEAINEAFSAGLVTIVADFVRLAAILVILFRIDFKLTLVALAAAPVLLAVAALARHYVRDAFRELRARLAALNTFLQEHVTGMKIVQMLGRQRDVAARFDERNRGFRDANLRAIKADSVLFAVVEMVSSFAVAALLLGAAGRIASGTLTVGVLVAFIQYIDRFFMPIRDLSTKYTIMQSAMAAAERIFGLLDVKELDARRVEGIAPAPVAQPVAAVELEHVRFGYKPDEPVLVDASMRVATGETVAVIGSTGAGKSTLIKLLARLYEIDGGRILVGGVDVRALEPNDLRRRIVVIPQDVFLFQGTLEENLSLGLPAQARPRLEDAVRRMGAERLLHRAGGWAHKLSERGANFSSGEKQLLALARALARDPEILILDEATASVDPDTERLVERGIEELSRGRTSIVIAHRLSTLTRADRIVVLHKGRVAEQGTHAELMSHQGLYAKLYKLHVTAASAAAPAAPAPA